MYHAVTPAATTTTMKTAATTTTTMKFDTIQYFTISIFNMHGVVLISEIRQSFEFTADLIYTIRLPSRSLT